MCEVDTDDDKLMLNVEQSLKSVLCHALNRPLIKRSIIIRTRMAHWRPRSCCFLCLQFLLLAVFQTDAYVSVNLERHCVQDSPPSILFLQKEGLYVAAIVELNIKSPSPDARCQLEVKAPSSHLLTVHLARQEQKQFHRSSSRKRQGFQPCYLKLSPQKDDNIPKRLSRTVNLCDNSNVPSDTIVLTNHLTLTWAPPDSSLADRMVATHLVITAIGRGAEVCSSRNRMLCLSSTLQLCITNELACDGFNNCPNSGDDENPTECAAAAALLSDPQQVIGDFLTKAVVRAISLKNDMAKEINSTASGEKKGLELSPLFSNVSSYLFKNFLTHKNTRTQNNETSTTTSTPPKATWNQQPPKNPTEMDSIPAALAHYGPWGYLMLGMLICGAILMLCGLWECCCRSTKHRLPPGGPLNNSAATTVFIINSAPHRNNHSQHLPEESPPTPGPPSYDELDQPPAYSSLFPMTKLASSEHINIQDNPVITGDHM